MTSREFITGYLRDMKDIADRLDVAEINAAVDLLFQAVHVICGVVHGGDIIVVPVD